MGQTMQCRMSRFQFLAKRGGHCLLCIPKKLIHPRSLSVTQPKSLFLFLLALTQKPLCLPPSGWKIPVQVRAQQRAIKEDPGNSPISQTICTCWALPRGPVGPGLCQVPIICLQRTISLKPFNWTSWTGPHEEQTPLRP